MTETSYFNECPLRVKYIGSSFLFSPSFKLLLLLLVQRGTDAIAHVKSGESAAAGREDKERHGVVRQVAVKALVEGAALREVRFQRFDLHQGAHHHEYVKDLVALPDEVTHPREQALRVRAAEEVGADQEKDHVVEMVRHHGVGAALLVAGVDTVNHGAYV